MGIVFLAGGTRDPAEPRVGLEPKEEGPRRSRGLAALRDLSGGMIAGWIRPSNHDLCVAHAARRDKREQGGRIAEREPHAAVRRGRAEAGMVQSRE